MAGYTGPIPSSMIIPVTRGCDAGFSIRRVDENGDPQDWDSAIKIVVGIDALNPTEISCLVNGPLATILIPSTVADLAKNVTMWQLIADGDIDTPLLVGRFERHDA